MFYIFIITLLVQTPIVAESLTLNVGTTLFTPADLAKKRWTKREVALLRARMYFQDMIPPIDVTQSPDYINSLIPYIENSYAAVNRSASDADTGKILKVAVSDVFGGYLKMVALPVTKLAYYNGVISTQEASKLFKYYEHIKEQLQTTGKGWSQALKNIAKPKKVRGVRSEATVPKIKNPCKRLLYFKNNQQNVSMPMPSIDWDTRKMLVPLKDTPIIDLKSPQMSSVLHQFHRVATDCERSITPDNRYFQGNFEDWVSDAVIPHLSDDDLYTAFKGILQLLDDSYIPPVSIETDKPSNPSKSIGQNMSMKNLVVVILVALELIFCIPTLLYCAMKNNMKIDSKLSSSPCGSKTKGCCYQQKNVFYELSPRSSSLCSETKTTSKENSTYYRRIMKKISCGLITASESRCSYTSLTDALTTADETLSIRRSSHQEITKRSPEYKITETDQVEVNQGQTQVSKTKMCPQKSSTSTIKNTSNDTGETVTLSTVLPQEKATSIVLRKSKRFRPRHVLESLDPDTFNQYPILGNISKASISNTVKELKLDIFDDRMDINVMRVNNPKIVEFLSPRASRIHSKTNTSSKNERQEIANKPKHLSEKPSKRRLPKDKVIPQNRKGILKSEEEKTKLKAKTSKIPKKINLPSNPCDSSSPRAKCEEPASRRKSMIPTPGRALEESTPHKNMLLKHERALANRTPHKNILSKPERVKKDTAPHRNMDPKLKRTLEDSAARRNVIPKVDKTQEDSMTHSNMIPNLERAQKDSTPHRAMTPKLDHTLDSTLHIKRIQTKWASDDTALQRTRIPTLEQAQENSTPNRNFIPNLERELENSTPRRSKIPKLNLEDSTLRTMIPQPDRTLNVITLYQTTIPKVDRTDGRARHRTKIPTRMMMGCGWALDDSALYSSSRRERKMNVTL